MTSRHRVRWDDPTLDDLAERAFERRLGFDPDPGERPRRGTPERAALSRIAAHPYDPEQERAYLDRRRRGYVTLAGVMRLVGATMLIVGAIGFGAATTASQVGVSVAVAVVGCLAYGVGLVEG